MQTKNLTDSRAQPLIVAVEGSKATNVHTYQICLGLAADDPLGQRPASPTRRRNADGVEASSNEEISKFGCLTENELVVGGERLGSVVELLDPSLV